MTVIEAVSPFNSTPTPIAGVTSLQALIGYASWGAIAVCLIALLSVGAGMAVANHRGEQFQVAHLGKVMLGAVIVGAAGTIGNAIMGFNLFTSDPAAIPGLTGVQQVIGYVAWACAAVGIIGILLLGVRMAMHHSRGEPVGDHLGSVALGCIIIASAGTIIGSVV